MAQAAQDAAAQDAAAQLASGPAASDQITRALPLGWRRTALLAEGTWGTVVLARRSGREVAVKVLARTPATEDAVRAEVAALGVVAGSPLVVRLDFECWQPQRICLGLELCQQDLLQHPAFEHAGNMSAVRFVAAEVTAALEHIHARHVLHNDLKLENVCVGRDGHIRLVDFGSALVLDAARHWDKQARRLQAVTKSGTLPYAAPEIFRRLPHAHESDLWSLGVMVYELLFGKLPWPVLDSSLAMCNAICQEQLTMPRELGVASDFVRRLLVKKQEDRLGFDSTTSVKAHPWLQGLDWAVLASAGYELPL